MSKIIRKFELRKELKLLRKQQMRLTIYLQGEIGTFSYFTELGRLKLREDKLVLCGINKRIAEIQKELIGD